MNDLPTQLQELARGRLCVLGIGRLDRGDDAAGPCLAQRLADARAQTACPSPNNSVDSCVITSISEPEAYLSRLEQSEFDHVLFIDAVEFGGEPGAVVLLDSAQMKSRWPQVSTHKISLGTLAEVIEAGCATRTWLLGIQPASVKPGTGLSAPVAASIDALGLLLTEVLAVRGSEGFLSV